MIAQNISHHLSRPIFRLTPSKPQANDYVTITLKEIHGKCETENEGG